MAWYSLRNKESNGELSNAKRLNFTLEAIRRSFVTFTKVTFCDIMKTWMHMTLQSVFMVEKKSSCGKKKSQSFSHIFWQDNLKTHSRYIWTAQGFGANSTSHWMKGTFWLAATDSYTLFLSGWQIWPWHSSKCWRILALLSCDVLFLHCTKVSFFFYPRSD